MSFFFLRGDLLPFFWFNLIQEDIALKFHQKHMYYFLKSHCYQAILDSKESKELHKGYLRSKQAKYWVDEWLSLEVFLLFIHTHCLGDPGWF